jgi:hypothetical protein
MVTFSTHGWAKKKAPDVRASEAVCRLNLPGTADAVAFMRPSHPVRIELSLVIANDSFFYFREDSLGCKTRQPS